MISSPHSHKTFLSSDSKGVLSGYLKMRWKAEKPHVLEQLLQIPQANNHSPLVTSNLRRHRETQVAASHYNLVPSQRDGFHPLLTVTGTSMNSLLYRKSYKTLGIRGHPSSKMPRFFPETA